MINICVMANDTSWHFKYMPEEWDHDGDEALATRPDEAKRPGGKGLLSYFSSEGNGSSNMGKENKHFCIYENCNKIIALGNKYTTEACRKVAYK